MPRKKERETWGGKLKQQPNARFDGELYARPWPNPFSENWHDGYLYGYDDQPIDKDTDREWRDGYATGIAQREYDREEADRSGSSNA